MEKFLYTLPFWFVMAVMGLCFSCNDDKISYNQHIRPIFNQNCLSCHGGVQQNGGFSLLFREDALGETDSGIPAIIPGDHAASELFRRISHHDPEERMPQESNALSKSEIDLIAKWIDQGAQWEDHWAYVPPQMPKIPGTGSDWPNVEWDHFILEKLQANKLKPAEQADLYTLIRRLSLDLRGIPPSPKEVEDFVNNPDYEALLDQMLSSPQFGERWASMWLDLARYADTKGYERDPARSIWRYRDWLINALNADMPFDQFTIEQLAGDMLPQPSASQILATAFHRNTMTNTEGGTDDEEFRVAAVVDRLNTTFNVWQSTSIACVQCHSHPYDPFRQEDFYGLMAFFNNSMDNDLSRDFPNQMHYEADVEEKMDEIIHFLQKDNPRIQPNTHRDAQIRQALFPRLRPLDNDGFHNLIIFPNGIIANWSNNLNDAQSRRYYYQYKDIPLDGLASIKVFYGSAGNDARLKVYADSLDGPLLAEAAFQSTGSVSGTEWVGNNRYHLKDIPLKPHAGKGNLVFEFVNSSGKAPEGILLVEEIELVYGDRTLLNNDSRTMRDSLILWRKQAARTPIMRERPTDFKRTTHVFDRGSFLSKGQKVSERIPPTLPSIPKADPSRLDFAKWLVNGENPLTARVMVNRFWEQIFGTGLVETLEDFGTQGFAPSHPELLDYLALRFQGPLDWSIKSLLKELLLSATYRQASVTSPQKLAIDPNNRLLSRGPRFRLSAEQVRDQALAVSGLLNDSIGGPSVMPPQPEGIWQSVYSNAAWKNDDGKNRYRRALYTYWKRTAPYPSMLAFDSPSREVCVSRRIRTNTPMQALITLNDPVYVEVAEILAEKMHEAGGGDISKAIQAGYSWVLCRPIDTDHLETLLHLYNSTQSNEPPPNHPAQKVSDIQVDEKLDPMVLVATALINLDAFLTKE